MKTETYYGPIAFVVTAVTLGLIFILGAFFCNNFNNLVWLVGSILIFFVALLVGVVVETKEQKKELTEDSLIVKVTNFLNS